jgi:hypothetical protein
MKFLLKQLHLYFPFVFPMCIGFPGPGGGTLKEGEVEMVNLLLALEKRVEELTARVKKLEEGKVKKIVRDHSPYDCSKRRVK